MQDHPVREPPGRHLAVIALVLGHIPVLAILGLRQGWSAGHIVAEVVIPLLGLGVVAWRSRRPRVAMGAGALGLMYASAVIIHVTGGVTEAHFYFFVAFGLVALYRDWFVFIGAALFAVAHHVFFALTGGSLFDQPYQLENPLFWAAVHVTFVALVTAVQAVGMYDVARSVEARTRLESDMTRARERRRTAISLHDDIVQALATANYATSLGDGETTARAVQQALRSSRSLVSELLADSPIDEQLLVRPEPITQHGTV